MRRFFRSAGSGAACTLLVILGACNKEPDAVAQTPQSSAPVESSSLSSEPEPTMACDQEKVSWAMGKPADEALVEKAREDAGAELVRVLKPGMMVTMEYNEKRLNLRVDENNLVVEITCG